MNNEERIEFFKQRAKPDYKYMTINISSWHMSIFPEFHVNYKEIEDKFLQEQKDPAGYSWIDLVYDLTAQNVIYIRG